jgi:hypothetical protein
VAGDRVLERISLPIVNTPLLFPPYQGGGKGGCEVKASEAPKTFGAENERKYSISDVHARNLMNNQGQGLYYPAETARITFESERTLIIVFTFPRGLKSPTTCKNLGLSFFHISE